MRIIVAVAVLMGAAVVTTPRAATAASTVPAGTAPLVQLAWDDAFTAGMLAEHNKYRARHGVPALKIDPTLTAYAGEWAAKMAHHDILSHSHGPYGENLYRSWPSQPTPAEIVRAWYGEIFRYDWNIPDYNTATGHFSQVVWKNSSKLGVGLAKSSSGRWYAVAVYNPPGNYAGQFPQNVLPPR